MISNECEDILMKQEDKLPETLYEQRIPAKGDENNVQTVLYMGRKKDDEDDYEDENEEDDFDDDDEFEEEPANEDELYEEDFDFDDDEDLFEDEDDVPYN